MESEITSEIETSIVDAISEPAAKRNGVRSVLAVVSNAIYPVALLASLSIWLLAIRAPLWLDETLSYWQVSGGFAKVWTRSAMMPSSIGYLYTLWLAKSILGSSEIALKIPSTIALLVAVFFLYRAVSVLFNQETAFLACIFFALEGNVIFAATDARPYAFAMMATCVATYAFARWIPERRMSQAILFGTAAAGILYFHYLFVAVLPAFAICYFAGRGKSIKNDLRQLAALLATFGFLIWPLIQRVSHLYRSRDTHVILAARHPVLTTLDTISPKQTLIGFVIIAFLAALVRKIKFPDRDRFPAFLCGPVLALVPAAILYVLSTATPMNLIQPRYLCAAAPGSALMWALFTSAVDSRLLRQLFCVGLVSTTVFHFYQSPASRLHDVTFKPAHELVNQILADENVPVIECSAFIESNYEPLPTDRTSENALTSQMYYYPINAPVMMLPISLTRDAVRISRQFVSDASQRHQKFILVATMTSAETVEWMMRYTTGAFNSRLIAHFDEIGVFEFRPVDTY